MPTPDQPPREVRVRKARMAAAAAVALPLTLSACGLFGGDNEDKAPVVIPSEAVDSVTPSGGAASPSSPSAVALPAPVKTTVTKTGIVVRRETVIRRTTATKTLPRATVTNTPPPITLTQTQTQTQTQTERETVISVQPAKTVVRPVTRTVTRTIIRTRTRTVTKKA